MITNQQSLFSTHKVPTWIASAMLQPSTCRLFGDFWFQNELCILFADSNIGKSILAVQIAQSLASGVSYCDLWQNETPPQNVLYLDFEMSAPQFLRRYSDLSNQFNAFNFSDRFMRVEFNSDFINNTNLSFEDLLFKSLDEELARLEYKTLIIDNLTYLRTDTENSGDALALMKQLKQLKNKYNLSLLVLAHTPKRDATKELTKNCLAGSKALINFCDSSFAIGKSCLDPTMRYLKQIKCRALEMKYESEAVHLTHISKKEDLFLRFYYNGLATEYEHLKPKTETDRTEQARELSDGGMTNVDIAKQLNVSEGAVRKWLKK